MPINHHTATQLYYSIFEETIPLTWKGGKGLKQRTGIGFNILCHKLLFLVLSFVLYFTTVLTKKAAMFSATG